MNALQNQAARAPTIVGQATASGTGQPNVMDNTILNEIKDTIKSIKQETNLLMQRPNVGPGQQVKCQTTSGTCVGPYLFLAVFALQIVVIIGYLTFKNRQDRISRKYL